MLTVAPGRPGQARAGELLGNECAYSVALGARVTLTMGARLCRGRWLVVVVVVVGGGAGAWRPHFGRQEKHAPCKLISGQSWAKRKAARARARGIVLASEPGACRRAAASHWPWTPLKSLSAARLAVRATSSSRASSSPMHRHYNDPGA